MKASKGEQGRNEVYGITDQRSEKGRDQRSQPWDLESQRVGSGSAVFSWNEGSGIKFLRVQGSKFSSFLGSGFKILGKILGSVTKNISRYDPE